MFPVVVLVLLGVVELAVVGRAQMEVVAAAREGARHAAVDPDPSRAADVTRSALGPSGSDAVVRVTRPPTVGAPAVVEVRLPHRMAARVFGGITINLTGTASMRVER